ncbi:hypothetical protein ECPA23_0879, partial [Escherichia coli PA23]
MTVKTDGHLQHN